MLDLSVHEVLVFIDGCKQTEKLIERFDWVNWSISEKSISASPARNKLYKKAKGCIFIGLDDDAHPLSLDFISSVEAEFNSNKKLGIIAFQEVRGQFGSDAEALAQAKNRTPHFTNDFVGCGFAIKKDVYKSSNGFPVWIDIYGEEPALALEVLNLGYQILYQPKIKVNHRVNAEQRKKQGKNYFRFKHQLQNSIRFYVVYYPNPVFQILKLLWHNFKKYAITDGVYFKSFISVLFETVCFLPKLLKHRAPVKQSTIKHKSNLKTLNYSA